jgi:hypothetical protein
VAKRIEAALLSLALPRGKQKRQIARFVGLNETSFQCNQESIRNPIPTNPEVQIASPDCTIATASAVDVIFTHLPSKTLTPLYQQPPITSTRIRRRRK